MNNNIAKKLLAFHKKVNVIKKDMENPYFKSQYFDVNAVIEVIKPVLNEVGLVVLQPLTTIDGKPAIETVILDTDSGEEYSKTSLITDLPKAQEMGSSITYFRRYSLVSMLLLQGEEDDDGNVASAKSDYAPRKVTPTTTLEKRKVIPTPIVDEDKPF